MNCKKTYWRMTAQEMHEMTGLPLAGWPYPNQKKKKVKCEKCGMDAELEVVPDGFDDAPATFTITREHVEARRAGA